ncbi:MAG TPA: hypothetical protein VE760_02835 [Acidimicrobiales bacterium]|nr:hypothetical protein [Acidimicrobiales bacterium]
MKATRRREGARRTRRRRVAAVALAAVTAVGAGACSRAPEERTVRIGPSFHSAGLESRKELESVLDKQARSIAAGDWGSVYAMYVPTERRRCPFEDFVLMAEQTFGGLRDQAEGTGLAAEVTDVRVSGFRASVDYRLVLPDYGLATQPQSARYLKLVDRWFLDEKAC